MSCGSRRNTPFGHNICQWQVSWLTAQTLVSPSRLPSGIETYSLLTVAGAASELNRFPFNHQRESREYTTYCIRTRLDRHILMLTVINIL